LEHDAVNTWLSALLKFVQLRQAALNAHADTATANTAALVQLATEAIAEHAATHPGAAPPAGEDTAP
jgi:hypothetical protein